MNRKTSHVVPSDGRWAVRISGSERATKVFDKKSDAVSKAKGIAKKEGTAVYIHHKDGTISASMSFRNAPKDNARTKRSADLYHVAKK